MSFLSNIFGDPNAKEVAKLRKIVDNVNNLETSIQTLSDEGLRSKTDEFKQRLLQGETMEAILPEAFAIVREASFRVLKQRQYDVQLIGGIALHMGMIAEMRTGEGKTLTAAAPTYLNALTGKGVHVITVNDYLARRDAVWMGQVYHLLGLTIGCIQHEGGFRYDPSFKNEVEHDQERDQTGSFRVDMDYLRPVSRHEAYTADITYGTNNEFGFDYLRDNMVGSVTDMVQRELHFAVIDEVDSILIDEARTPLIISAPAEDPGEMYYRFAELVSRLEITTDYTIDEKLRAATLTESGINKIEQWLGVENLYVQGGLRMVHHLEQALRANVLYKRDKDYVVQNDEVIIVDEFTGRLMQGRRYSEGLHQAIEAKEHVTIQRESVTMATITFQNLFRLYSKLSGMTGTAMTEAEEFYKIYKLEVLQIPTNRETQRKDLPDRVYKTELGKFKAVIREIRTLHEKGQPVLVGTSSIEKNEILSELLRMEGIPFNLLNAKNHEHEAEFIAQAGRKGAVTIATNMAGRGVDIILGGNPVDPKEAEEVRALGGLFVLGTERHESRRIDNQLRGRSGRQGDPGQTQFYVSMEDDLMRIFGTDRMKRNMELFRVPEDEAIESKMLSRAIEGAQKKVEGHHFDIRKHLLEYDDVLNKHRMVVYKHRREVLKLAHTPTIDGERPVKAMVMTAIEREVEQISLFHTADENVENWNLDELENAFVALFSSKDKVHTALKEFIEQNSQQDIVLRRTALIEGMMKVAKDEYQAIEQSVGDSVRMGEIEKNVLVQATDMLWVEHLEAIDHLRRGIGLRSYGQRDPLVEYKKEAFRLYNELLAMIDKQSAHAVFRLQIAMQTAIDSMQSEMARTAGANPAQVVLSGPEKGASATNFVSTAGIVEKPNVTNSTNEPIKAVGRNELCPCGSGKKYKKCHGAEK
ncbi:preprotein translocase subunit SecA [Candidatus Uhrbacteria bacterium]|nr:preprotein translocase subunit SecA [Candidatus Uhrbacteria bacterium]